MIILGIETSCDETALSLIEAAGDINHPQFKIIQTALHSQIASHAQFGGVYPTLAKREHSANIIPLLGSILSNFCKDSNSLFELSQEKKKSIESILSKEDGLANRLIAEITMHPKPQIDLISVTKGPGLEPALWVGINVAKALSVAWEIPLCPVNHMEGHILSVLIDSQNNTASQKINFPAIALLISGGHTEIVLVKAFGEYKLLGQTRDDAVGEAFDKVARLLGLAYPGGPQISRLAEMEVAGTETLPEEILQMIKLPRPMIHTDDFDFSFSGLKTAVLYLVKKINEKDMMTDSLKILIAKEFQKAVIDVLLTKTKKAIDQYAAQSLIIGGGVIANKSIKENFAELNTDNFHVHIPNMDLATDNGVMIAFAGYISSFRKTPVINPEVKADGNQKYE